MTIKEIAEMLNIHRSTVYRIAKELYPEKFKNGAKTKFSEDESINIVSNIRKKGFITPVQNAKEPVQNAKLDELIDSVSKLIKLVTQQNEVLFNLIKNIQISNNFKKIELNKPEENKNNSNINIDDILNENFNSYEWYYISSIAKQFNCDKKIIYKALLEKGIAYYSDYTGKYEFKDYYIENDLIRFFNKIPLLRRQLVEEIKPVINKLIKKEKTLF